MAIPESEPRSQPTPRLETEATPEEKPRKSKTLEDLVEKSEKEKKKKTAKAKLDCLREKVRKKFDKDITVDIDKAKKRIDEKTDPNEAEKEAERVIDEVIDEALNIQQMRRVERVRIESSKEAIKREIEEETALYAIMGERFKGIEGEDDIKAVQRQLARKFLSTRALLSSLGISLADENPEEVKAVLHTNGVRIFGNFEVYSNLGLFYSQLSNPAQLKSLARDIHQLDIALEAFGDKPILTNIKKLTQGIHEELAKDGAKDYKTQVRQKAYTISQLIMEDNEWKEAQRLKDDKRRQKEETILKTTAGIAQTQLSFDNNGDIEELSESSPARQVRSLLQSFSRRAETKVETVRKGQPPETETDTIASAEKQAISEVLEELTDLAENVETYEQLISDADTSIMRTRFLEFSFESEIKSALSEAARQDNPKEAFEQIISDERIHQIMADYFPVDMKNVIELISSGKTDLQNNPRYKELQKYMDRRRALGEAMKKYRDKISSHLEEYYSDENGVISKIEDALIARRNRNSEFPAPKEKKQPKLYLTRNGNYVLVYEDAESFADIVAPRLIRDPNNPDHYMSREELISYLSGEGKDDLGKQTMFQMAVNLDSIDDTVVVAYLGPETVESVASPGEEGDEYLEVFLDTRDSEYKKKMIAAGFSEHDPRHSFQNILLKSLRKESKVEIAHILAEDRTNRALFELAARVGSDEPCQNIGDLYLTNPQKASSVDGVIPESRKYAENMDRDLQVVINIINELLLETQDDPERLESIARTISNITEQMGLEGYEVEDIKNFKREDLRRTLAWLIDSYVYHRSVFSEDKKNVEEGRTQLTVLIDLIRRISGKDENYIQNMYQNLQNMEVYYVPSKPEGRTQYSPYSTDLDILQRDPVTQIISIATRRSPVTPRIFDMGAHDVAMLYGDTIPIIGRHIKRARAWLRYQLTPGLKSKGPFYEFWQSVQNNPARVTQKAEAGKWLGILSTDEILGTFKNVASAHGRSYGEIMGVTVTDEHGGDIDAAIAALEQQRLDIPQDDRKALAALDRRISTLKKRREITGERIEAGLVGRVVSRLPFLTHPSETYSWGDNAIKILGRGGFARYVGKLFFGESVTPRQRIQFTAPPKMHMSYGYTSKDKENGRENEPDGKPRVLVIEKGNSVPVKNPTTGRFEFVPYIPYQAVLPSMEAHNSATLTILTEMMAKTGIPRQTLNFMLWQALPEINFDPRGGAITFNQEAFTRPLKFTDLDYDTRLQQNRESVARSIAEVKRTIFGDPNLDGEDIKPGDIKEGDIIRGHISSELVESMVDLLRQYGSEGMGADHHGDRYEKVYTEHEIAIRHIHRAMEYENALRALRKKYLEADEKSNTQTLTAQLSAIQAAIDSKYTELRENRVNHRQALTEAFSTVLEGATVTFKYKGRTVTISGDKIAKLFAKTRTDGTPERIITKSTDIDNSPFGFGQLWQMAYDSELNDTEGIAGTGEVYIGGGFRIHKAEVQIFQRTLYYEYFRRVMDQGLPADTIHIPSILGKQFELDIRAEYWGKVPPRQSRDILNDYDTLNRIAAIREIQQRIQELETQINTTTDPQIKAELERAKGELEHNLTKYQTIDSEYIPAVLTLQDYFFAESLKLYKEKGCEDDLYTLFDIDPNATDREELLRKKFEEFSKVVEASDKDNTFLCNVFGQNAALLKTLYDDRGGTVGVAPVKKMPELMSRFFEQGAVIEEVEENLGMLEEQNRLFAEMTRYLTFASEAIPYAKARSEILKKRADCIKYFRWAMFALFALKFFCYNPSLPFLSVWPPGWSTGAVVAVIGLSYLEAYHLRVKSKYWSERELNAINYVADLNQLTTSLADKIRRFYIPSAEEVKRYPDLESKYEKLFESISEVDQDKLGKAVSQNMMTNLVAGVLSGFKIG